MSKNYLNPFILSGYSWPFIFDAKTKHIEKQMQFWCQNVSDVTQPILLTKSDYNELLKIVSKDFLPIGTPMYCGRAIKKKKGGGIK